MGESLPNKLAFEPSIVAVSQARDRLDLHDRYFYMLLIVLCGYALLGKGFAYMGMPPLLIGEITMLIGLVFLYRARAGIAILANWSSILMLILLGLVMARTAKDVGPYGIDAIRDSVIALYALFGFIAIGLMLEKPERLDVIIRQYGRFALWYPILGAGGYMLSTQFLEQLPTWPHSGTPLIDVKGGDVGVHLGGAAVFMLLGLRKANALWLLTLVVAIMLITASRGGLLSCLVPLLIASVLGGHITRLVKLLAIGAVVLLVAYAVDFSIPLPGANAGRTIGPEQLIDSFKSITGNSDSANLDATKEWRLRWWKAIVEYTLHGPYFWTGKGFGMGLAEADGFIVGLELGGPILRSPHNVHFTILARLGIPGIVLWGLLLGVWLLMMLRNIVIARMSGETHWANLFIWLACYLGGVIINATFDVAIEGPMMGSWCWALIGLGIGASMIFNHSMRQRRQAAEMV
jgi:hypothetical protein